MVPSEPERALSARAKRSKILSTNCGSIPGPLSTTVIRAWLRSAETRNPAITVVPSSVCLRAFESRFRITCCSCERSAIISTGSSGTSSRHTWVRAAACISERHSISSSVRSISSNCGSRPSSKRASSSRSSTRRDMRTVCESMRASDDCPFSLIASVQRIISE